MREALTPRQSQWCIYSLCSDQPSSTLQHPTVQLQPQPKSTNNSNSLWNKFWWKIQLFKLIDRLVVSSLYPESHWRASWIKLQFRGEKTRMWLSFIRGMMRLVLTSMRGWLASVDLQVGDVDSLPENVARHAAVEASVLQVHRVDGVAVRVARVCSPPQQHQTLWRHRISFQ